MIIRVGETILPHPFHTFVYLTHRKDCVNT
nr:MAG TPA: hypothetical protein [Caudoviricetes sp.]